MENKINTHRPMKAKDLIEALSRLNPDAEVVINVKQSNKHFGVVQLPISMDESYGVEEAYNRFYWVNGSYMGATITVHLPSGAFVSKLPKQ